MDASDKEMIWEEEDKVKYDRESSCYICNEPFITIVESSVMESCKGVKVRDHCHYTGKYNLGGYDGHLIFQNLAKLEGIKEPMEKIVTFSIGHLKFKDSSLAKLVNNLAGKV